MNVFDVTGRLVENLASRRFAAGTPRLAFDGANHASGTYIVRLTRADNTLAQKIVLVK